MTMIIAFVVLSAGIFFFSRSSLRAPGSHGFYRFFGAECVAALVALNLEVWFANPLSWYQLISWFLLIVCIIPLVLGIRSLVSRGKPDARARKEPSLIAFEKTSMLVTSGIYRYIRHPMYSSLLLLTWGVFFKDPGWLGVILAAVATFFWFATAIADEQECIRFFGPQYQEYMKHTRRFLPFLF